MILFDAWQGNYITSILCFTDSGKIALRFVRIMVPLLLYRGIGTIDIELTNIDINQCDAAVDVADELDVSSVDVFRGTHRCYPTTKV